MKNQSDTKKPFGFYAKALALKTQFQKSESNFFIKSAPDPQVYLLKEELAEVQKPTPQYNPNDDLGNQLHIIESETSQFSHQMDASLRAWSFWSKLVNFTSCALFLRKNELFSLAFLKGFDCKFTKSLGSISNYIPKVLSQAPKSAAMQELASILKLHPNDDFDASVIAQGTNLIGLWVYADTRLSELDTATTNKLRSLIANSIHPDSLFELDTIAKGPAKSLRDCASSSPYACAMLLDFEKAALHLDESMPQINSIALRSLFTHSAERIMGTQNAAVAIGKYKFACVLGSENPLDADLTLFQYRKSLNKALPSIGLDYLPTGVAIAFQPKASDVFSTLFKFLTG